MKKLFSVLSLAVAMFSITGAACAGEAEVRKAAEQLVPPGAKIDAIRKAGVLGLYEVQIGQEILYIDEKGQFVIAGDIWEVKNRVNLTEERKNKLSQVKFSDLPLNMAIKQVRGNGQRVFVSFEDPNCGYCKRFAKDVQGMTDVTHYVFVYPILGPDSVEKSKNVMCSADPVKTWSDWMLGGVVPPLVKSCDVDLEKYIALGQRLKVRGTPNIILSDGSRIPGAVPAAKLEEKLNAVRK